MPDNNCQTIIGSTKVESTRAQDIQSAVDAVERVNDRLSEINRRIIGEDNHEAPSEALRGEPILSEMLHGAPTRIRDLCEAINVSLGELEGQIF